MEISAVKVYSKTNSVKYHLENGVLRIWIDDRVEEAPEEATYSAIHKRATSFQIQEISENG